jgi:hypothetical protein
MLADVSVLHRNTGKKPLDCRAELRLPSHLELTAELPILPLPDFLLRNQNGPPATLVVAPDGPLLVRGLPALSAGAIVRVSTCLKQKTKIGFVLHLLDADALFKID